MIREGQVRRGGRGKWPVMGFVRGHAKNFSLTLDLHALCGLFCFFVPSRRTVVCRKSLNEAHSLCLVYPAVGLVYCYVFLFFRSCCRVALCSPLQIILQLPSYRRFSAFAIILRCHIGLLQGPFHTY